MTGPDDVRDRGPRPAAAGEGPPGPGQPAEGPGQPAEGPGQPADGPAQTIANGSDQPADGPGADPLADTDPDDALDHAAAALDDAAADAVAADATPEVEAAIEADEAALEVEEDIEVAGVARQRDEYLDALRRLQADFENYKKRMIRQQTDHLERAAASLVEKLLPVFDTADLAIAHGGGEEVKQIWTALFETLEREGLERIDPLNIAFDPTVHDAVAHEPGDGEGEPEVVEVMRAGYRWKGRILRPAMVKVRG
jgi:molecular chaperone GrpE